jgi:phytanoyl-CoA hydroxylase
MNLNNVNQFVDEYNEHGFVKLESFLNNDELEQARNEVDVFINNNEKELKGRDINYSDGKINSVHCLHKSKWISDVQHSDSVQELVSLFLNEAGEARGAELFAKPALSGLASPLHQDNYYWCVDNANALTVWVALDDASEDNGGIYYYKGTHKLGLLEHKPSYAPGSSQTIKYPEGMSYFKKITPALKAGDCLIHHSLIVHGSNANTSANSRRGWTMQFKGKKSSYDESMKKRYQDSLNAQIKMRK